MYSRTNVNPVSTNLNSQNAITTGVSLLYTESFNELKDILKSSRNKNKSKPEDEIEITRSQRITLVRVLFVPTQKQVSKADAPSLYEVVSEVIIDDEPTGLSQD